MSGISISKRGQLQLHNSLTGKKEPFVPMEPGRARIYVCGMTVYDYCHLGHARVLVVFDMITRFLRASGFDVTYVRNITDIDDKIIARAIENNESMNDLTERFIAAMHEDAKALGVLPPDLEPKATDSMDQILGMIASLVARGFAYQADNNDVYYRVAQFDGYGKLSGKRLDDLRIGARVEVDEAKEDPLDFVLWKSVKPGEPAWDSPWGPGRPGWHIECSAMSTHCLGANFDIHGGGMDLKFPHHENEIAQSEAATGQHFVNYWIHNGFVEIDDEKMSKSLGNFFTVREVLKQFSPEVVRFFILGSHYRSPLAYSQDNLIQAKASLDRLYMSLLDVNVGDEVSQGDASRPFHDAMNDDFNTPQALSVLFDLARELNRAKVDGDQSRSSALASGLKALGGILGILQGDPEHYFKHQRSAPSLAGEELAEQMSPEDIEDWIGKRTQARADKNWPESDRIRDLLQAEGVILEDKAEGTFWRRA